MSKNYFQRNLVKKQWCDMLVSGKMPIIEQDTKEGLLIVEFWLSDYGVGFLWGFENTEKFDCGKIKPYFDGSIKKRNDGYVLSFAEIDRMNYSLDAVLQLIWDNISDGILSAYNLHV